MSKQEISPSEEKVSATQNSKPPQNTAEVRSFLGLVQYCAKFQPDYAQVVEPLRILTRRGQHFMWGDAQEKSFQKLKDLLTQADTLAYFKNECSTRIIADAGPAGIGAVLTQLQDGMWRVISYASRNITDVERRYSQTEKEGFALVWACERFKLYVYGRRFELEIDHKPLKHIYNTSSKPSARTERWVLSLLGYNFKVIYRPGKINIADALSRLNSMDQKGPSGEEADFVRVIVPESMPIAMTTREVKRNSEKDPDWSQC